MFFLFIYLYMFGIEVIQKKWKVISLPYFNIVVIDTLLMIT